MTLPPKYPLQTLMATEAKAVAELNKILTMSLSRLDQDIKALGKAGLNPLTLMQAKATRAALESFLAETFDDVESVIRVGVKNAAAAASGVVSAYEAQMLGMVMSPEAVANLAKSEAQRAAQGIEAAMQRVSGNSYQPLSSSVYKTQQLTLKWVDKRITQGLASGWSASKLAGELKGMIDPSVKGGVSYAAMRTARTEINNAFHASSAERYANSPIVTEVEWHLSSSHPEGDICDDLAADSPYPKKSVPQKPHPHCYCYITPALPEPAKFVDNLFKGKYGSPPTGAAAQAVKANLPAAAGSKAASTLAQNAMNAAIKADKAPTKSALGKKMGITTNSIEDAESFAALLAKLDDETLAWVKKNGSAKYMMAKVDSAIDDLDSMAAWATKQAKPKAPPVKDQKPSWDSGSAVGSFSDEDYDLLLDFLDTQSMKTLQKNNIDPVAAFKMIDEMGELAFDVWMKIVAQAEGSDPKWILKTMDLDHKSKSFLGDLVQMSKGLPPKKIETWISVGQEFKLSTTVVNDLMEMQKLTPDQAKVQLLKLSADELAEIKKLDAYDQGYFIKHATTPTKESLVKPTTPSGAPSYNSLAQVLKLSENDLVESGATPQQIQFLLYGNPPKTAGLLSTVKNYDVEFQKKYAALAKNFDLKNEIGSDYDKWIVANKFVDADDIPVPKASFVDFEDQYGVPEHVFTSAGMNPDDVAAAFKWIDDHPDHHLFTKLENAFESFDEEELLGAIEAAIKNSKLPPIKPSTLPKVKTPDPPPVPKELYESYEDVADIFVKAEWKPNLLAKTGASPQQIADYVEDMNQAQYDHFMGLKWPSQKKHFEKLAESKVDNAAAYQAKVETAKGVAVEASKIKPPITSDPKIIEKWRGKDQPGKPIEPKPPKGTNVDVDMAAWLEKVEQKYEAFAPGKKLQNSNNWSYVKQAMGGDMTAADYLYNNKYIDFKLTDEIHSLITKMSTPSPEDARAYKSALEAYAKAKAGFDSDIVNWRAANGITNTSKGVWDGALVHKDNNTAVAWANSNLHTPSPGSRGYEGMRKYSGGSYTEWNNALRKNANADSVPSGSWGEWTRKGDSAMVPQIEDVIVRRGTGWGEFISDGSRRNHIPPPPPSDLIGSVQTQHGYTSTSVGQTSAFSGSVNMRIRVPQGHPTAWVDPYSAHKGERELVLSRSTNFFIHDVYQEGGKWFVDAEVIPFGEDAGSWVPIPSPRK